MMEPSRLIDVEGGPALQLLRAAQDVSPAPAGAADRALRALGLATPAPAVAAPTLAVVKWLALGVVIGVGGSAVAVATHNPPSAAPLQQPAATTSTVSVPAPIASSVVSEPQLAPNSPVVKRRTEIPSSPSGASQSATLADEVAELDRVRAALARGSVDRAVVILDEFDLRFSRPQLAPEAGLLRVRALAAAGQTQAAQNLAQRLIASESSPDYAAQVREAAGLKAP